MKVLLEKNIFKPNLLNILSSLCREVCDSILTEQRDGICCMLL
jgi:hypothetical protein